MDKKILSKRTDGRSKKVVELTKRFLGKECIITTLTTQLTGTVTEVVDGALLLQGAQGPEVINLDFIIRIREFPRKKNGKKKSVVLE